MAKPFEQRRNSEVRRALAVRPSAAQGNANLAWVALRAERKLANIIYYDTKIPKYQLTRV
jgi:hypothetical protein